MKTFRAVAGCLAILSLALLQSCGGGYNSPSSSMPPAAITISVNPTSIVLGQSSTLPGRPAAARRVPQAVPGAALRPSRGSMTETPTAAGMETFTLSCSSGAYSSSNNSLR